MSAALRPVSVDTLLKIFRSSPAAIALVRVPGGVVLDVNEAYERLFGWRREEAIGRTSEALRVWVEPGDRARFLEQLAAGGRVRDFESRARRKDGAIFDSRVSADLIEEDGERIALVMVTDHSAQRRTEEARALLAAVIETSSDAIILSDRDQRIVTWSTGAERMFGWTGAEAVGRELSIIVPPRLGEEPRRNLGLMRRGIAPAPFETMRKARDGRELRVQIGVSGVYRADGGLELVAGIYRDVTDRDRAEAALRQSEARLRRAEAVAHTGHFEFDAGGDDLIASDEFKRLFGFEASAAISLSDCAPRVHPQDIDRIRGDLAASARDLRGFDLEYRIRRPDGTGVVVQSVAEITPPGAAGAPPRFFGTLVDITERKRSEDALRQSEQRFRALVDLSSDWYWVTDLEHRFTFREGAILRRMGIAPETDYGKRRWEMGFLNVDEAGWAAHRAVLERREEFRDLLLERRSPDGRVHWAMISGRPLHDADGAFLGYHGTGRDVTAQVSAERRLRQFNVELEHKVVERTAALDAANRELQSALQSLQDSQEALLQSEKLAALGRLVAGVAHELNTPIGNSLLAASTLADRTRAFAGATSAASLRRATVTEYVADATEAGAILLRNLERAAHLIASFKQVAADQSSSQRREFALAELVDEVVLAHHPMLKKSPIVVAIDVPAGIRLDSFPGPLGQVLGNLVTNAVVHGYEGASEGRVEVSARVDRDALVEIAVADRGRGIAERDHKRIFDPFYTTRLGRGGTGLGLAICHRIVGETLGGTIAVRSHPGEGATFIVRIPLVAPLAPAQRVA